MKNTKLLIAIAIIVLAAGVFAWMDANKTPSITAAQQAAPAGTQQVSDEGDATLPQPEESLSVIHYQAETMPNAQVALQTLKEQSEKISTIVAKEALEESDLEQIHEISYTLEAAIDKLIAEKAGQAQALEAVDEAVQAIHFASEKHEEDITRNWAPKLTAAVQNIEQAAPAAAKADPSNTTYHIIIKDHLFSPSETIVPADKKIKLIVDNQDPTPEEFESHDMNREKVISGNRKATIYVGPLKPGTYHYFGEFNEATAQGTIVAQ